MARDDDDGRLDADVFQQAGQQQRSIDTVGLAGCQRLAGQAHPLAGLYLGGRVEIEGRIHVAGIARSQGIIERLNLGAHAALQVAGKGRAGRQKAMRFPDQGLYGRVIGRDEGAEIAGLIQRVTGHRILRGQGRRIDCQQVQGQRLVHQRLAGREIVDMDADGGRRQRVQRGNALGQKDREQILGHARAGRNRQRIDAFVTVTVDPDGDPQAPPHVTLIGHVERKQGLLAPGQQVDDRAVHGIQPHAAGNGDAVQIIGAVGEALVRFSHGYGLSANSSVRWTQYTVRRKRGQCASPCFAS